MGQRWMQLYTSRKPPLLLRIVLVMNRPLGDRPKSLTSPGPPNSTAAGRGAFKNKSEMREPALMRINVWIVLIVVIALFAITRLLRYQQDTQRICTDDPSASVGAR